MEIGKSLKHVVWNTVSDSVYGSTAKLVCNSVHYTPFHLANNSVRSFVGFILLDRIWYTIK